MTEGKDKAVVAELAGPRMPADHGLASLGLLMQLGGAIYLAFNVTLALTPVLSPGQQEQTWWMFVIGAVGAVRSAFHRTAGAALSFGHPQGPLRPTQVYIGVAALQTAITLFAIKKLFGPLGGEVMPLTPIFLLLIAWPAALAVVISRPRMRRLVSDALPISEDRGFEGASLLMTLFGITGALILAFLLVGMLKGGGQIMSSGYGMLTLALVGMLLGRSLVHARAGLAGLGGIANPEQFSNLAARYYNFGVVSSIIAGGALLIMLMMTAFQPAAMLPVGVLVYLLLAWPLSLRRFFVERNFSAFLAGEQAPTFQRAPDQGLTALGWLLLAGGAIGLAGSLPHVISSDRALEEMRGTGLLLLGLLGSGGNVSPWLAVGISAVQLWAAAELIMASDRNRLAASVYGVVGTVATLYIHWDVFKAIKKMGLLAVLGSSDGGMPFSGVMMLFFPTMSLVIALGSLLLANRRPTPQARLVER